MSGQLRERREAAREALARTILRLLFSLAAAIIALVVLQGKLHVPADSIRLLERLFLGVLGLAAAVAKSYFTGPR